MKIRILSLILTLSLIALLVGCSKPNPEQTLVSCFDDIKQGKFEEINKYFTESNSDLEKITAESKEEEGMEKLFTKLDYEILESKVEKNNATVKVKTTTADIPVIMGMLMQDALQAAFSGNDSDIETEMDNKLIEIAESDDMPVFSEEYIVNLKFEEGKWLILPDENFANAISGNLVQKMKDAQEEMTEE